MTYLTLALRILANELLLTAQEQLNQAEQSLRSMEEGGSTMSQSDRYEIRSGNASLLQSLSGAAKRTAERLDQPPDSAQEGAA